MTGYAQMKLLYIIDVQKGYKKQKTHQIIDEFLLGRTLKIIITSINLRQNRCQFFHYYMQIHDSACFCLWYLRSLL